MPTLTRILVNFVGVTWLFLGSALFLCNLTQPADLASVADPLFGLPLPRVFWLAGSGAMILGVVCLFLRRTPLQTGLSGMTAAAFLAGREYASATGQSAGFAGYLGGLGDFFAVRAGTAEVSLLGMSGAILVLCLVAYFAAKPPRAMESTCTQTK